MTEKPTKPTIIKRVPKASVIKRQEEEKIKQPGLKNYVGPKGDTGPQGPEGPKGPKGDTGKPGPRGPMGPRGPEGPAGKDGRNGRDGLPGTRGHRGRDGRGVPSGGSTGYILAKASDTSYDTEWIENTGGTGGNSYFPGGW